MDQTTHNAIVNFIRGIAEDIESGTYPVYDGAVQGEFTQRFVLQYASWAESDRDNPPSQTEA